MASNETLSERELEILRLVAKGATNQQIARTLFISVNTVKVHLRNIFAKLGVESRTEATTAAIRQGLIQVEGAILDAGAVETPAIAWADEVPRPTRFQRAYLLVAIALVAALTILPIVVAGSRSAAPTTVFVDQSDSTLLSTQRMSSRWTVRAAMPTPRGRAAVVEVGGGILVVGGVAGGQVLGVVEEYAPDVDRWTSLPSKPTATANVSAVVLDGKVYIPGGYDSSGRVLSILDVYDVAAQTWDEGPSLPAPRCAYALAAIGGQVYLFGGWDGKEYVDTVFRFDPAEGRWDELSPMPVALGFQAVASLSGKAYLIGGYDGASEFAACYEYDPAQEGTGSSPWTERAPMSIARGGAAATVVGASIYVIGGGWESFLAYNERYEPRSDTWVRFETPLTGQWRNLGVAASGTSLYAIGGWSGEDLAFNGEYQAIFRIVVPHTVR